MQSLLPILLTLSVLLPTATLADRPGDNRAIAGMETGRIMWDITIGDPQHLIGRLAVIEQTFDDMVRQGLKPEMVLGFRGGAAGLIAASPDHRDDREAFVLRQVHERLQGLLQRDSVHMEACGLATQRFDLAQEDLLPGIHLVGNTFLSIMGYENQGYSTIRLD
ncbi:MAG: hypothetical protein EA417_08780 [Gammaproteobacteria bacterium]|nr:MAG: hypothetical protein EA417_08780 [Gammaproteobacteria bacterium]